MSTTDELHKMVLQFKVSDLQSLLSFAGQNKMGRKTELQKKALNLIQTRKSVPLEMKVRNLYRQMVAENAAAVEGRYDQYQSAFDNYNNYYLPTASSNGYASSQSVPNGGGGGYGGAYNTRNGYGGADNSSNSYYGGSIWSRPTNNGYSSSNSNSHLHHNGSNSSNNISINLSSSANSFRSSAASKFDYASYLPANTKIPAADDLKHVVFKKLSFYNYKSCVYPLTPLIPRSQHSELFEFTLPFNLNQQQHSLVNWAKKSGKESRYQIQLRICQLDAATGGDVNLAAASAAAQPCHIDDSLPLALGVKVNDKNCQLPPAIPSTNKQGMLLKRMNAPINLTPQTRRNHANNLVIYWSVECNQLYGFTIHLVEKYTSDELIDELVKRGERDPQITKNYLKAKLNGGGGSGAESDDDDDIAATSLKVSLLCPLGKILMTLPVRASSCDHLQCFDGALYLKMNEVKSTWQCPVCNKLCRYEDLFVDGFFADVLRNGGLGNDVNEIQIEADGSVVPIVPKKRSNSSSSPAAANGSPRKRLRLTLAGKEERCEAADSSLVKNRDPSPDDECCRRPQPQPTFSSSSSSPPAPAPSTPSQQSSVDSSLPPFIPIFNSYSSSSTSFAQQRSRTSDDKDDGGGFEAAVAASSSSLSNDGEQPKKNVVLVDLTETDSESEDDCTSYSPLNLAPPVYDIDDSDFW